MRNRHAESHRETGYCCKGGLYKDSRSNPEPAVSGKVGASLRERTVSYSLSFLLEPFHTSPKEAERVSTVCWTTVQGAEGSVCWL